MYRLIEGLRRNKMNKKRVVVTGMGIVSCFGNDVDLFYDCLLAGKSGARLITSFPTEAFATKFAAMIDDFDPDPYLDKKQARRVDKDIRYAVVAGKKALEHAGFSLNDLSMIDKKRAGVLIGSGMGGMDTFVTGVTALHTAGPRRVSPFFVPYILTNMGGAILAQDVGFMGPNYSISTACATSNYSIISAANHIRSGEADLMICGGTEASIYPICVAGFNACKALSQRNDAPEKASRPWDIDRDGFVLGEGAGVLVLESLEHALARGAPILAEYLGGGTSCDAHHITEPRSDGGGVALCISKAISDAEISLNQINYINAHATSTPAGDMAEVNALKSIFPHPDQIMMNCTKSLIGHCLGAAGGLEAIATIQAMRRGLIHPTLNLENPEPNIGFKISSKVEKQEINVAISNSFGFGGHNATVVFKGYQV